ncbi:MAG: hypothetical protein AN484_26950, partial [Aphanizomenon flos-aquae WA102]
MELVGSLMAVRLAKVVKDSLSLKFGATRFFTDSSSVLGMLKGDSASYLEFVGTRVSEIKTKSSPEEEWFWVPTKCNLADMGTRANVTPEEMSEGTPYQDGQPWMYQPVDSWPVKKTFTAPPPEEMKNKIRQAACNLVREETWISRLSKRAGTGRSFERLQRIVAYVVLIADRFKGQTDLNVLPGQVTRKIKKDGSVLVKYRPAHPCSLSMATAEAILIEDAQRGMSLKATASLMPREVETTYVIGQPRKLVVVGQRPQEYLQSVFKKPALPILRYDSPLARRVMISAHEVDHS